MKSFSLRKMIFSFGMIVIASCQSADKSELISPEIRETITLKEIKKEAVATLNSDLQEGRLTMDVGIIIPSNFDSTFKLVSADQLFDGIKSAKEIFAAVDVQINLLWLKTGEFNPDNLAIVANEPPSMPGSKHLPAYERMWRGKQRLSDQALETFDSLIEPHPDNHRTIYLVALQEVFFYFQNENEQGDYELLTTPTSGLSFPPYIYGRFIPNHLRGVISISNLSRGENRFKTIAHEIGHKAMNVTHEYKDIKPAFEIVGEGGLMIYGSGTDIPSGAEGLWHKERLSVSPFVYKLGSEGQKEWNLDFQNGGYYYDSIYGNFVDR